MSSDVTKNIYGIYSETVLWLQIKEAWKYSKLHESHAAPLNVIFAGAYLYCTCLGSLIIQEKGKTDEII